VIVGITLEEGEFIMKIPKRIDFDPLKLTGLLGEIYRAMIIEDWKFNYFLDDRGSLLLEDDHSGILIRVSPSSDLFKGVRISFVAEKKVVTCDNTETFIEYLNKWAMEEARRRSDEILTLFNFPHREDPTP